jgi:molybdopterin synthase catalytic subunit
MSDTFPIRVQYYAFIRERLGKRCEDLDVPADCDLKTFEALWLSRYPEHQGILEFVRLAVGDTYVGSDHLLKSGDEISFIPPVSGGSGSADEKVRLTHESLEWGGAERLLNCDGSGAVATFRGVIRKHAQGKDVVQLSYHARESMALKMMHAERERVMARADITDVAIWHRLGTLQVGELAVEIAVSSPHRAEAFEECRAIIEAFKKDIPVFKHEVFADGTESWKHRCH